MKRLGIYVIYDENGIVDDYIFYFINEIKRFLERLVIVCNGNVNRENYARLQQVADDVYIRENKGFDACAIRKVLIDYYGWDKVCEYDGVLVMNDTFFGPLFPMDTIFETMDRKGVDLWGLLGRIKGETESSNRTLFGAFFYYMSRKLLLNEFWRTFWDELGDKCTTFSETICNYEYQLIPQCLKAGGTWDVYLRSDEFIGERIISSFDDYTNNSYDLIKYYGYPFLKRKPFVSKMYYAKSNLDSLVKAINYIDYELEYDVKLIWQNVLRKYDLFNIMQTTHMNKIIVEDMLKQPDSGAALCVFIFEIEDLRFDYLELLRALLGGIKISVYSSNQKIIDYLGNGLPKESNIQICYFENKKGIIDCVFEDSKMYDTVFYYDDESLLTRTNPIEINRTVLNTIIQCLCKSPSYIGKIVDEFKEDENLGAGISPFLYHSDYLGSLQGDWTISRESLVELLHIDSTVKIPVNDLCVNQIPAFWTRSVIFRKTVEILQSKKNKEEEIGIYLATMVPYVAQQMSYYTKRFSSSMAAEIQISNLQYLLRQFLAKEKENNVEIHSQRDLDYFGLERFCSMYETIYIYGAGVLGKRVLHRIKDKKNIKGFIVSDGHREEMTLETYPIFELSELLDVNGVGVVIAISDNKKELLIKQLRNAGINTYFTLG